MFPVKKLLLTTALLFTAACQQQSGEESLLQERQGETELKYVTDSDPVERKNLTSQQAARHLAKIAVEVPDVHDATAIVLGNYVAVGIDVDKDLDRSASGSLSIPSLKRSSMIRTASRQPSLPMQTGSNAFEDLAERLLKDIRSKV